jgi:hypothetical protein
MIVAAAGCAHTSPPSQGSAALKCYTEAGYLDSTNGCAEPAGFPDCYLVCPEQGIRKRL